MGIIPGVSCPIYIENRVWQWDGRFSEASLGAFVNQTFHVDVLGFEQPLTFVSEFTWLQPKDYQTNKRECIRLVPDQKSVEILRRWFGDDMGWTLVFLNIWFCNFGVLNMQTGFAIGDDCGVESWELKGNAICDRLDGLVPILLQLINEVDAVIGHEHYGPYVFGYPDTLSSDDGISPEASYFFTNQYFLDASDPRFLALCECLRCGGVHRLFGRVEARTAANGTVWAINGSLDEELLLKAMGLSSRVLAEWALSTAPVLVYTALLGESLKRHAKTSSMQLRRLVMYNRLQLQKMAYLYKLLQEHEVRFCFEQREACAIAEELKSLRRAEETVELIAGDLDQRWTRRSTAWIEWLVFVFTGMTSLSVLSDIVNYLSDNGVPVIADLPTRSILLLAMSGVLALLLGYTARLGDRRRR